MIKLKAPPTSNHAKRIAFVDGKPKPVNTERYKKWRKEAAKLIAAEPAIPALGDRPSAVRIFAAVNYQRDLDNLLKPVLDALKTSGKIADDRWPDLEQLRRVPPKGMEPEPYIPATAWLGIPFAARELAPKEILVELTEIPGLIPSRARKASSERPQRPARKKRGAKVGEARRTRERPDPVHSDKPSPPWLLESDEIPEELIGEDPRARARRGPG